MPNLGVSIWPYKAHKAVLGSVAVAVAVAVAGAVAFSVAVAAAVAVAFAGAATVDVAADFAAAVAAAVAVAFAFAVAVVVVADTFCMYMYIHGLFNDSDIFIDFVLVLLIAFFIRLGFSPGDCRHWRIGRWPHPFWGCC